MSPVSAAQHCDPSAPPASAQQCRQSVLSVNATQQCCPPMPPISAYHCCISVQHHQCHLISASSSVPLTSAAYQCPLVLPIHATSSVPPISAYYCLSVQPHQRTSVKEKNYLFAKFYNRNKETFFSNFLLLFMFI
ncbi:unnamed protein product, partial [Staurois parvus]